METRQVLRNYIRVRTPQGYLKLPVAKHQEPIRPLVAGNWKMNPTSYSGAFELLKNFQVEVKNVTDVDILIAPPSVYLLPLSEALRRSGYGNIVLGSQNNFWEEKGAFTGEISPLMLRDIGVDWVIIGHSERRLILGETDQIVNRKVRGALNAGLNPIVCVGEQSEDRESGMTKVVIEQQVKASLEGLTAKEWQKITIAYEPVWAIGTGKSATPEQADEVHAFIRDIVSSLQGESLALNLRILYGGSVVPENINGLMSKDNIDGVLVGGASLKPESFAKIVKFGLES